MADAIVRENSLHYAGNNFYKVNAPALMVGDVGEKRTPITKGNFLEGKDRIKAAKLKIREIGEVKISSSRTQKRDFLANVNLAKVFKLGSADAAYQAVLNSELFLMYVKVDTDDLVRAINSSPAIRADLQRWGNDARVVGSGFIVVNATTKRHLTSTSDIEADINVHGVTIKPKLSLSTEDQTDLVCPVGSLYAYGLWRILWDSNKKPTQVVDLKFDPHGL